MASEGKAADAPLGSGGDVDTAAVEKYFEDEAFLFYTELSGVDFNCVGTYESESDTMAAAQQRSIDQLMEPAAGSITPDTFIVDLGSGRGGTSRYLAKKYNCKVTGVNLSKAENALSARIIEERGLSHLVKVVTGLFDDLTFEDNSVDIVISQEAFIHAPDRQKVFREAFRVLKPGGLLLFSDEMENEDVSAEEMKELYARIPGTHKLGSPKGYERCGELAGFEFLGFTDKTPQLATDFRRLHKDLVARRTELAEEKGMGAFWEKAKTGLEGWIAGAESGLLRWGTFGFKKPATA